MVVLAETEEVRHLADTYIDTTVVGSRSRTDALHVAYATIYRCDGVVSWNYKHMAQNSKALLFNKANASMGLSQLFIATPKEALDHEKDEEE